MPRTPARITQADVRRIIAAARQAGAHSVDVLAGGETTIRILLDGPPVASVVLPADPFTEWEREHESAKAARHSERI
jgi:hypothetical protein